MKRKSDTKRDFGEFPLPLGLQIDRVLETRCSRVLDPHNLGALYRKRSTRSRHTLHRRTPPFGLARQLQRVCFGQLCLILEARTGQPLQHLEGAPSPFRVSGSSGESSAHLAGIGSRLLVNTFPEAWFFSEPAQLFHSGCLSSSLSISRCSSASPLCLTSLER